MKDGDPLPIQVSWDGSTDRQRKALDMFYDAHPRAAEAVFVTAESFAQGIPELHTGRLR